MASVLLVNETDIQGGLMASVLLLIVSGPARLLSSLAGPGGPSSLFLVYFN